MKVQIKLDPACPEPVLTIRAARLTPQLQALAQRLESEEEGRLLGWQGERVTVLDSASLTRFYAQDRGVFCQDTAGETYALRLRLYELEEQLDPRRFVRISNSELVNLGQITALDLKLSGTIKLTLTGGVTSFVSRRNVKKLKEALGL